MENNENDRIQEILDNHVTGIKKSGSNIIINTDSGEDIVLYNPSLGNDVFAEIERCSLCDCPSRYPMVTINNKTICKSCVEKAAVTFAVSGIRLNFKETYNASSQ